MLLVLKKKLLLIGKMNKTENKKKEDILKKAKKIVSIDGWSSEIFSNSTNIIGYPL